MFLYTKQKHEIYNQKKNNKTKLIIKKNKYLINKIRKNFLEALFFLSRFRIFFIFITSACDKEKNLIILSITNDIIFEYIICGI